MNASRPNLDPIEIPGYTYLRRLGAGGFAQVFLYEKHMPRQQVAIKVLDTVAAGREGQARFVAEANAMATVSAHPYVVTILDAAVAANDHPYIVMEYYPGPNYSVRAKTERFSVSDVLQLGIRLASAVETAHRAGILHRDLKPANILTSAYGRPGLTDFGIATTVGVDTAELEGLSIPWSPPEVIAGDRTVDHRADIYALGATLYTVLAGRSPFEDPSGSNSSLDLINRIERSPLPPLDRPDVPGALQRLLSHVMAKDPESRPDSAAEMARALQAIESDLQLVVTPLEVADLPADPDTPNDTQQQIDAEAGSTRLKSPTRIDSQKRFAPPSDSTTRQPDVPPPAPTPPSRITGAPFALPDSPQHPPAVARPNRTASSATIRSSPASGAYIAEPPPAATASIVTSQRRRWPFVAAAVALVCLAVVGIVALGGGGAVDSGVPAPVVSAWDTTGGSPTEWQVRWTQRDHQPGDEYVVLYDGKSIPVTSGSFFQIVTVLGDAKPVEVVRKRNGVSSPPGIRRPQ